MCPVCAPEANSVTYIDRDVLFYYTDNGVYYHVQPNCSGMRNASAHSLSAAVKSGKLHCPVCIGDNAELYWAPAPEKDDDVVYFNDEMPYYHIDPECFGLEKTAGTLAEALEAPYTACPVCLASQNPLDSGTRCYVSDDDGRYHYDPECFGLPAGSYKEIYEIEAQADGRTRCRLCAAIKPEYYDTFLAAFGQELSSLFPGYSFERADALANGDIVWRISADEETDFSSGFTAREVTLSFDYPDGTPSRILLGMDMGGLLAAPKEFFELLPEPLYAVYVNQVPDSLRAAIKEAEMGMDPEEYLSQLVSISVNFDSDGQVSSYIFHFSDFHGVIDLIATAQEDGSFDIGLHSNESWA